MPPPVHLHHHPPSLFCRYLVSAANSTGMVEPHGSRNENGVHVHSLGEQDVGRKRRRSGQFQKRKKTRNEIEAHLQAVPPLRGPTAVASDLTLVAGTSRMELQANWSSNRGKVIEVEYPDTPKKIRRNGQGRNRRRNKKGTPINVGPLPEGDDAVRLFTPARKPRTYPMDAYFSPGFNLTMAFRTLQMESSVRELFFIHCLLLSDFIIHSSRPPEDLLSFLRTFLCRPHPTSWVLASQKVTSMSRVSK